MLVFPTIGIYLVDSGLFLVGMVELVCSMLIPKRSIPSPFTYVPGGNPPRGIFFLGNRVPSSYTTAPRGIYPGGNYVQWGGYHFIPLSSHRIYFFGASSS